MSPKREPKATPESIREVANHVATQFGTEYPEYKFLTAAAFALEDGDIEKTKRILRAVGITLLP